MNSYRDGSSLEVIIYYGYISLISIFILVTFLIREIGHENFVLLLFINALLIGLINPRETYKWYHCTFFTIPKSEPFYNFFLVGHIADKDI